MDNLEKSPRSLPGPWAWYVFLAVGHVLSGLFPWLMVSWAAYRRGNNRSAFLSLAPNLLIYILLSFFMITAKIPWWWLTSSVYAFNLTWTMSAWIFQRKLIGTAPRRYVWADRSAWISPLSIGLFVGMGLFIIMNISSALSIRSEMYRFGAVLDRESVLWSLLGNAWGGVPFGLLLGLWWAGEGKRFSASRLITFLAAWLSNYVFLILTGLLIIFLVTQGESFSHSLFRSAEWALFPPWLSGWPKALNEFTRHDSSKLLVIPLLFGAAPRLRDFFKRLLWLPVAVLIAFPFIFISNQWWGLFQDRIIYNMASPDQSTSAAAYIKAERLLARYPQHLQWPAVAEAVARYKYQSNRIESAADLYQTIIRRFQGDNRWQWEVGRARAAVGSGRFGHTGELLKLNIPMIDYESYLTHNWMAVLSIIRFWEGPDVSESSVKMGLKAISKEEDKIELNPLVTMLDLDDAVRSLNYQMAVLPSNLNDIKTLLSASMPVLMVDKGIFRVVYGFDESRSAVLVYGFDLISYQTRHEARKEAKEILALKTEGHGESQSRLERIRREVAAEYSTDFWNDRTLRYRSPYMVVIFPEDRAQGLSYALGRPLDTIAKESKGLVASFIGLAFLQHANPEEALEWAKISSALFSSSLPLDVGCLAQKFWDSREKKIKTRLPFEAQFPELKEAARDFEKPENAAFLANAKNRFQTDLNKDVLPYFLMDVLEKILVPKDPEDQELLIDLENKRVAVDASDKEAWEMLARLYEYRADSAGMIRALEGLSTADPLDFSAKLQLAYISVLAGDYTKAESVLEVTDLEKMRFDGDYPFCRGALAEWKHEPKAALKYYKQAIDLRRYKPIYHLRYGRLLMAEGRKEEAEKALKWAAMIDATGSVKSQAEQLLSNISADNDKHQVNSRR